MLLKTAVQLGWGGVFCQVLVPGFRGGLTPKTCWVLGIYLVVRTLFPSDMAVVPRQLKTFLFQQHTNRRNMFFRA